MPVVRRWAKYTGTMLSTTTTAATTLISEPLPPVRSPVQIQIGIVVLPPAVKIVTMTSSHDSAKASRPPATNALRSSGKST